MRSARSPSVEIGVQRHVEQNPTGDERANKKKKVLFRGNSKYKIGKNQACWKPV